MSELPGQDRTGFGTLPGMDPTRIRDAFVALGRGDVASLSDLFAEDVVLEFPGSRFGGRFQGKRKVTIFLKRNQRLFRDGLTFELSWVGGTDDRIVVQWTNHGSTLSGIDYSNRGVTVLRIQDEQVVELQDYLDTEQMAQTWPEAE